MRKELADNQMESVVGGTVIISKDYMKVGFDTLGQMYDLKNCTYKEARNYRDDLIEQNPQMSNVEFDKFCRSKFQERNWI